MLLNRKEKRMSMSSPVVLINVFEVPAGTESDFIEWWKRSSEAMKKEPGFIDARLHRSRKPDARFRFINVAHWETEEALDLARCRNKDVLQSLQQGRGFPATYEAVLQY
jgi:quinol monooxygenase YgiN